MGLCSLGLAGLGVSLGLVCEPMNVQRWVLSYNRPILSTYQDYVHYILRKYFFANRVIRTWNSLPDSVIEANSVSKIGLINTGIILSSNITGRLTPLDRRL